MTDISRFGAADLNSLPAQLREAIEEIGRRTGFVPNVFPALARRPAELGAFLALHDALMEREESGLTKAEREMVVVATSAANNCLYCVIAHGAILRIRTKQPQLADRIAVNHRRAQLTARQRAMLDFAVKVARDSSTIEDGDLVTLRGHGFSDDDIWDIGAIAAFFAYSNRMADLLALEPNPQFFTLGRDNTDS
jgi:uncharacterized peroxidase-related enzyme